MSGPVQSEVIHEGLNAVAVVADEQHPFNLFLLRHRVGHDDVSKGTGTGAGHTRAVGRKGVSYARVRGGVGEAHCTAGGDRRAHRQILALEVAVQGAIEAEERRERSESSDPERGGVNWGGKEVEAKDNQR